MTASASERLHAPTSALRPVVIWLIVCAALVFAMVILGGLTRLTQSGLSMVEWRPVTGWLPPLDQAGWMSAFEDYKRFPEYQKINRGMSLDEFKSIFWFEFLHRLLGRTVGLVFLLPFLFFAVTRRINGSLAIRLVGIFVLGGVQGGVGWWMVASGLVDHPDVSHYRLAVHLGLAVLIYGALLWTVLNIHFEGLALGEQARPRHHRGALACLAAIFLTLLSGALVAGLDAGFAYNTFPTMNGMWIPDGIMALSPWYANFTENTITVQFDHRWLASATAAGVLALWWTERSRQRTGFAEFSIHFLVVAVIAQFALGVATVILVVPVPVAAAHQAGAMVLFTAALFAAYALRGRREGLVGMHS